MATSVSIDHDQAIIDSALAKITLPKGVVFVSAEFGEDHTGDPGVWLTFAADTNVPLNKKRVRELAEFSLAVSRALYDKGIERIPYVRYSEVRRRGAA
jgi:hypothetical protein